MLDVEIVHRIFPEEAASTVQFDRHYLLASRSGLVRLEAEGRRWTLPPSRAALIRAGIDIEVQVLREVHATSFLFASTATSVPLLSLSVFSVSPLARALLDEATGLVVEPNGKPHAAQTVRDAVLDALVAVVWRDAAEPIPLSIPTGRSAVVRDALELTEARLSEELTMTEIAAAVAVAPRTLARRFNDELGMSWQGALRTLRVLRATELLVSTDDAVSSIAFAVGYGSLSSFNAAFRDLVGRTPSEFRNGDAGPGPRA